MKQLIENVKVGRSVVVINSSPMHRPYIGVVSKVTKTMIVADGIRYNRFTGRRCGENNSWYSQYIGIATPEKTKAVREEQQHRQIVRKLDSDSWKCFSLDELIKINTLVKEIENARTA